jgi:molybdopterin-containing oxidoreductase family membrane subunit
MTDAAGPSVRTPLIVGRQLSEVTLDICRPLDTRPTWKWWAGFLPSLVLLVLGAAAVTYQVMTGIGTWGLNRTIGWAFDITNFVFWIGIGHAGTLISAILFLFRQRWRTSVNRAAEAMTLFAVMCAGLFPIIHMGRPWLFYWILPYPNTRGSLWVNFRSPLVWDFFAISTYFTISAMFWYVGLIPDLATARDRTPPGWRRRIYEVCSLGWNGSHRTWQRYEILYLLLAGLATPLVVSVHTIVSWDFATSVIPGWHATVFPPYFVAGAIFSGMAMVLTLMLVARTTMGLEAYITQRHVDVMCKLIILTSGIVALAYGTEFFMALYSANRYEQFVFKNRALGPMAWAYWTMVACNVLVPQFFWFASVRRRFAVVFVLTLFVNVGMWFERFVIVVTSLHRDYLPSSWSSYAPTSIEVVTLIGSFGLFFSAFLLFCRFVPVIAISEVKGVIGTTPGAATLPRQDEGAHRRPALTGVEA